MTERSGWKTRQALIMMRRTLDVNHTGVKMFVWLNIRSEILYWTHC
jgi:hypothetical protein